MEVATEIIFFEEATGVDIEEKVYESLQETQVSSYEVDTAPRVTVATLSHGISYLLVDSFVSYYPVKLVLYVSVRPLGPPVWVPNKAFISAKSQLRMFHERTSSVNACAHWSCAEGCAHQHSILIHL